MTHRARREKRNAGRSLRASRAKGYAKGFAQRHARSPAQLLPDPLRRIMAVLQRALHLTNGKITGARLHQADRLRETRGGQHRRAGKKQRMRPLHFLPRRVVLRQRQVVVVQHDILLQPAVIGAGGKLHGVDKIFNIVQRNAIIPVSKNHAGASGVETEQTKRQRFPRTINHPGTKDGDRKILAVRRRSGVLRRDLFGKRNREDIRLNLGLRIRVAQLGLLDVGSIFVDDLLSADQAIDGNRAGIDNVPDAEAQRGVKHTLGAATIGIEKVREIAGCFDHRGDVIHNAGALHGTRDGLRVAEIAGHHLRAGRGEFVGPSRRPRQSAHRRSLSQQTPNQRSAKKARRPSDANTYGRVIHGRIMRGRIRHGRIMHARMIAFRAASLQAGMAAGPAATGNQMSVLCSALSRRLDMSHVAYLRPVLGSFFPRRVYQHAALLAATLACVAAPSAGQTAAAPQTQEKSSISEALERSYKGQTQLNIFYVHGMGIDAIQYGTQDFAVSQEFRTSLCKTIGCTTKMGEFESRDYASVGHFRIGEGAPPLSYLGEELWKKSAANEDDDWHAAAPFVDHYKLVRENGTTIQFHEINWWPLILSAKCRHVVAAEAALVDPDKKHIATCAATTVEDPEHPKRFKSYAWIDKDKPKHEPGWPEPAVINRALKQNLLDWGFADALLAVGEMHDYLVEGIRETILASYTPAEHQEFIVVTHSLGSYLMFSALDLNDTQAEAHPEWKLKFETVLSQTSHAYFMANQVRLLELANLDKSKNGNLVSHLENWANLRTQAQQAVPQIVAWSDPGDLLTWKVPQLERGDPQGAKSVVITNLPAKNAWRWFGLLENPEKAHVGYDQNKHVVRVMVPKSGAAPPNK